ncbi:hypothetical protein [Actinoallomurus sp. NPDC050550]|uniref:hypothetical protein n=1 Tax=Actinoallomurus sp. NPDC050550 TaxID=3154937 RepID=UPI003400D9D4
MNRRIWLSVLSRVGFGTRYRWLAASSFFAVQGNRGFDGRLNRELDHIHQAVTTGSATSAESWLQTRTFAFLEDLRARHRKLSPTLRGFKRPVPSVVFLKNVTGRNGGVALLLAMSDVRSRRSELHPLLVVASVDHAHRADIDDLPGVRRTTDALSPLARYEQWLESLARAQGPSAQVALPWLLRLPISVGSPIRAAPPPLKLRIRPRWTWLWSGRSLLVLLAALAVGGSYLHAQLTSTHCSVHGLFFANTDTQLRTNPAGSRECVGIATSGVRFERGPVSTALGGGRAGPNPAHTAGQSRRVATGGPPAERRRPGRRRPGQLLRHPPRAAALLRSGRDRQRRGRGRPQGPGRPAARADADRLPLPRIGQRLRRGAGRGRPEGVAGRPVLHDAALRRHRRHRRQGPGGLPELDGCPLRPGVLRRGGPRTSVA